MRDTEIALVPAYTKQTNKHYMKKKNITKKTVTDTAININDTDPSVVENKGIVSDAITLDVFNITSPLFATVSRATLLKEKKKKFILKKKINKQTHHLMDLQ
jgi:hypothetical protein